MSSVFADGNEGFRPLTNEKDGNRLETAPFHLLHGAR
jgi:hypothetical protein